MAHVQIKITLDDGTVLSDTTANPTDVQINQAILLVSTANGYSTQVFDGDGNLIDNPQSRPDHFVGCLRSMIKTRLTAMAADSAGAAAAAVVKATPITF